MDPLTNEVVVNEDAALDVELEATLSAIKTGNESPAPVAEVKAEEPTPVETKAEDTSTPPEVKKDEYEFRVPNKGKFESDESYEK